MTGYDVAVNVYPMFNMTITADKNDVSGHFQIRVGSDITAPLSWQATDTAVLTALQVGNTTTPCLLCTIYTYPSLIYLILSIHLSYTLSLISLLFLSPSCRT